MLNSLDSTHLRHLEYLHAEHCFLSSWVISQFPSDLQTGSSSLWVLRRKNALIKVILYFLIKYIQIFFKLQVKYSNFLLSF